MVLDVTDRRELLSPGLLLQSWLLWRSRSLCRSRCSALSASRLPTQQSLQLFNLLLLDLVAEDVQELLVEVAGPAQLPYLTWHP